MKNPENSRSRLLGLLLGWVIVASTVTASTPSASVLRIDPESGRLELVIGDTRLDLGGLEFSSRQAGANGQVSIATLHRVNDSEWRLTGDPALGEIRVSTRAPEMGVLELSFDLSGVNRTGLFRPVLALARPGVIDLAESTRPRRDGDRTVARADLGAVILAAKYDATNVARAMVAMGDGNLIAWRQHSRVIDLPSWPKFVLELSVESKAAVEAHASLASRLAALNADTRARLQAWQSLMTPRGGSSVDDQVSDLRRHLDRLEQRIIAHLRDAGGEVETLYRHYGELRAEAEALSAAMVKVMREQRPSLRDAARERFAGMQYRAGLARDGNPTAGEYDDWALFRMGLVRLAVNPVWHEGMDRAGRIERIRTALDAVDEFGGKVVLSVHEEQAAHGPEDLTFTNEFIPALRSGFHEFGFNSARLRKTKLGVFGDWLEATREHPAVWSYKIDNEPFWSTQEYPIFGYDEATVGCEPEVFAAAMRKAYPDFAAWRERIAGTLAAEIIPWENWSDVRLAPGAAEGLTLVDYLRDRYRTLAELNRVWGTEYAAWTEVFPPLPEVEAAREADDSGSPEFDIGAFNPGQHPRPLPPRGQENRWADWTRFWAHNINDELQGFVALGRSRGTAIPITTNCLAGHMYTADDVTHSLFPWVTTDGLDALAIDFYRMGYLQGYLRTLAGAAHGRPIEIHETGGSDTAEDAWFTTAFAYAYGARGTLFWRRDHRLAPASALGVAEAIDTLDHADMQTNSTPLTDDILVVYPFEGLHESGARRDGAVRVEALQATLLWAKREQWLYTVVADRDLATELPARRPRCVVIPAGAFLSARDWTALSEYVRDGGAAVVADDLGQWDLQGQSREAAARSILLRHERVQVLETSVWDELLEAVREAKGALLGLAGETPIRLREAAKFVRSHAPAKVKYVDADGQLRLTHAAVRASDDAWYVFVDPWSDGVALHTSQSVTAATDLGTGEELFINQNGNDLRILVPQGATVVRLNLAP